MSRQTALTEAVSLPPAERIDLVMEIWDSIAAHPEQVETTAAQKTELDRRRAAYEADPKSAIPWEQVADELEGEL
jgi:putative addiction module component (TIGR02574 family)